MRHHLRLLLLVSAAWVLLGTGCSPAAKQTRRLQQADQYLADGDFDKAEVEYLNALKADPANGYAIGRLGILYFQQGRMSRAPAYLLKGRELRPEDCPVRVQLSVLYLAMKRFADARTEVAYVLQHQPENPEAPLVLAQASAQPKEIQEATTLLQHLPTARTAPVLSALALLDLRQQKFTEAEALLHQAQAADAKFAQLYSVLGVYYQATKNLKLAGDAFGAAAQLSPLRSPARFQQIRFDIQNGQTEQARQLLTDLTKKAPDTLTAWLLLAEMAYQEKKYDDGLDFVGKILGRDPDSLQALMLDARLFLAKGDTDKALAELDRLGKIQNKSPELEYQYGLTYFTAGDLAKAADNLNQAIILAPKYLDPIMLLAEVNLKKKDYSPVVTAMKPVVEKLPDLVQAQEMLAAAYVGQQNYDEAMALYRQLAEKHPQSPYILQIAALDRQLGHPDEARQLFEHALEVNPDLVAASEELIDMDLTIRDFASARKRAEALKARHPDQPIPYLLLGKIAVAQNDSAQAETAFQKAVELEPASPVADLALASVYATTHQDQKALASLELAARNMPKNPQILFSIGQTQERLKNYPAARDAYEQALAVEPKFSDALNNLAYIYAEYLNQLDKAQDLAQRARTLAPTEPHIADTLGWILYERGQYQRAVPLLQESAAKLPNEADAQFHLGMALYMMGDQEAARNALQHAADIGHDLPGKDLLTQRLALLNQPATATGPEMRAGLEKLIARQPDDPVALTRLALLDSNEGHSDKARTALNTVLQANPHNLEASLALIRVYQARKETAQALELAKSVHNDAPGNAAATRLLGRLAFETGDYVWAAGLLQEALRNEPNDPALLFDFAEAAFSVGRSAEAEDAMRQVQQSGLVFPGTQEAARFLDMAALAANPNPDALPKVEQILKADPNYVPALMAQGLIDEKRGEIPAARQSYEKALERYPNFSPAKKRLALLAAAAATSDAKALDLANQARNAFPQDAEVAQALCILCYRNGDFGRAASLLKESIDRLGEDPRRLFYLGMAQYRLKDAGGAQSLQRALELGLKDDAAAEARRTLAEKK